MSTRTAASPAPSLAARPPFERPRARLMPPGGPVRVILDPDDSVDCVRELAGRHHLDGGVVVCHPGPRIGSRTPLGADLLTALGRRSDSGGRLLGKPRVRSEWELAELWIGAERVKHLVVLRAHLLAPDRWNDLAQLAATTAATVWLVNHRARIDPAHLAALAAAEVRHGSGASTVTSVSWPWRRALDELPIPPADPPTGFAAAVPDVDWPAFRAAARQLLAPSEFARVDQLYRHTFALARHEARQWRASQPHHQRAYDAVQRLTVEATTTAELITRLRAAQAGFFREGALLRLCSEHGLEHASDLGTDLTARSDPHTIARLRTLCSPPAAAALAISLATGRPAPCLHRLRVRDIQPDTHTSAHTSIDTAPCPAGAARVAISGTWYLLPGAFAAAVRAAVADRARGPATSPRDPDGEQPLFAHERREPGTSRSDGPKRLIEAAAGHAGLTVPRVIGHTPVIDLRESQATRAAAR